jgi:hypothetical protein
MRLSTLPILTARQIFQSNRRCSERRSSDCVNDRQLIALVITNFLALAFFKKLDKANYRWHPKHH